MTEVISIVSLKDINKVEDVALGGIKGIKRQSVTLSVLIILAAMSVILPRSAHNVPKVGLAYDPGNYSLYIVHMSPEPESQPEMTTDMGSGIGSDVSHLWPYHLALVSSGFILMLSGALTARSVKKRKGWLTIHRSLGIVGAALVLVGLIVAVIMVFPRPFQIIPLR